MRVVVGGQGTDRNAGSTNTVSRFETETLTSTQTMLIEIGARLVRHTRRLVFQLAEVSVTRDIQVGMLHRIGRLCLDLG
jgi:hypothetical protein